MNGKKNIKIKFAALAVAALLVAGAATSFAKGSWGGPFDDNRAGSMARALDLTTEQEKEVRKIVREADVKRDDIRDRYRQQRDAERAEADKLRASTEASISGVLTEAQRAKFKEFTDRRDERGGSRGDCGGPKGFKSFNCGDRQPGDCGNCNKGPR